MTTFKVYILIFLCHFAYCLPEQGIWRVKISENDKGPHIFPFAKIMFNGTTVYLKITCKSSDPKLRIKVSWLLRYSPCVNEYTRVGKDEAERYLNETKHSELLRPLHRDFGFEYRYFESENESHSCNELITLETSPKANIHKVTPKPTTKTIRTTENPKKQNKTTKQRKRRAATGNIKPVESQNRSSELPVTDRLRIKLEKVSKLDSNMTEKEKKRKKAVTTVRPKGSSDDLHQHEMTKTWRDGAYLFVVNISTSSKHKFESEITVWMKASYGYLSALEYPFLVFYGIMCLVYLGFGVAWIVLSACHWRDLLRVQFWIGAVILLGMLEKAMFYAEYQSINSSGHSVRGAVIFAEFVSCVKRTLARLLVMVVSIGYGIVKPRLGPALVKVVVIGIIYFIFALIEDCIRVLRPRYYISKINFVVLAPLALVDAIILWWTFTYLVQTIKQLRLRRNLVKFNLYKHFSNILILVVGASVVFMGWSLIYLKWFNCRKHWRELWVDDAFWHILFSVILLVIIWLWRPSKNNQRYAYSPVLDADDDADEDILMDNFTTGEMTKKGNVAENGTSKREPKAEDDLRWVEEHIPSSSAAENVFPLGDSDEEIATTKFHLNKME